MNIILLTGGPGSGKSTQGSGLMGLSKQFKHLSLGEVVRSALQDPDHPITKKYKDLISSGDLLPDEVIFSILENELEKIKNLDIVVLLDGYPRTNKQYDQLKQKWGMPAALIHLDVAEEVLYQRIQHRDGVRSDDNEQAIRKRLNFYTQTTKPLINTIKTDLNKNAITVNTQDSIKTTSLFLYTQLQRITTIHETLKTEVQNSAIKPLVDPNLKSISSLGVLSQLWQTGTDEYAAIMGIQTNYQTNNFSFSILGKPVVYLETGPEVKAVLEAKSSLGQVYRQFSLAAGLNYDFVATDAHEANSYRLADKSVNIWKLIHNGLSLAIKNDQKRIEQLIDKHLNQTFFAEKTFDLDTTFDAFFTSFWAEYLLGSNISLASYQENRSHLLAAMKHCFYNNHYKSLDPSGLSSWFYSYTVGSQLNAAKQKITDFISKSSDQSMIQRFKSAVETINSNEQLNLDKETITKIVTDNVFDLIFEPDFLENVLYEALVSVIKENADLRGSSARNKAYAQGLQQGYLFPLRSRILHEPVTLPNGNELPIGSMVYLNMKQSGVYHSSGARRCVGQSYSHYFKEHFFNRLEAIEFKVKTITLPADREASDKNVPVSPERYQVSWHLRRDEAMRHLSFHNYKGNKFFDVLSLHQNPSLNAQIVKQLHLKISQYLQKNKIDLNDVVIVTPEVRGIPAAAQVAASLQMPLHIIRKKGGYKMNENQVFLENYDKGYGDPDAVELPIEQIKSLTGKKVIFLDDGLASGKSALACLKLVEKECGENKKPAQVVLVMSLLKHDYVKTDPKLSENRLVKTLFDCHGGAFQPTPVTSTPTICSAIIGEEIGNAIGSSLRDPLINY